MLLADEAASQVPGVSFASMLQTFAGLALVLALFVGTAWLVHRLNGGRPLAGGSGPMRVVGTLPVSPRERILLIEIEDTWLVVAVSPGQMRTLHTQPRGELPPGAAVNEGQFAHWLQRFREPPATSKH